MGLLLKLGLWSFKVTNACFLAVVVIRSAMHSFVAIVLSPVLMLCSNDVGAFL